MKLVIGTDEAGYGPNLGPLVVAGTAWSINPSDNAPETGSPFNWFHIFQEQFVPPDQASGDKIRVGDSKKIYQSGSGLAELEKLVFSLLTADRRNESSTRHDDSSTEWSWKQLLCALLQNFDAWESSTSECPWHRQYDPQLPQSLNREQVFQLAALFSNNSNCSCPISQSVQLVEPQQFNLGIAKWGNKASLLSQATFSIVEYLIESALEHSGATFDEIVVLCDKHGGRSRYAGMLQSVFADCWIQVVEEQPELSRYSFQWKGLPVHMEFRAKGESELPIATASMIAKYLREISMQAVNQFWGDKIAGLRPTAGYPVDAKRFRSEIQPMADKLGIPESIWWRSK